MSEWIEINPPAYEAQTHLRLTLRREQRRHGRFHLTAHDGERWVHAAFYDWDEWESQWGGVLLLPAFLAEAEAAAMAAKRAGGR